MKRTGFSEEQISGMIKSCRGGRRLAGSRQMPTLDLEDPLNSVLVGAKKPGHCPDSRRMAPSLSVP
nr:hypothetical protein [uncultured Cohaesibacter sp.]